MTTGAGYPDDDWWDSIGRLGWQHVVLIVAAIAAFVALCLSPASTCSLSITDSATTTTTEAR